MHAVVETAAASVACVPLISNLMTLMDVVAAVAAVDVIFSHELIAKSSPGSQDRLPRSGRLNGNKTYQVPATYNVHSTYLIFRVFLFPFCACRIEWGMLRILVLSCVAYSRKVGTKYQPMPCTTRSSNSTSQARGVGKRLSHRPRACAFNGGYR
ncbi:unnamed protein product, partial [Laminaria digitata]